MPGGGRAGPRPRLPESLGMEIKKRSPTEAVGCIISETPGLVYPESERQSGGFFNGLPEKGRDLGGVGFLRRRAGVRRTRRRRKYEAVLAFESVTSICARVCGFRDGPDHVH